jgi:hypothetical protein
VEGREEMKETLVARGSGMVDRAGNSATDLASSELPRESSCVMANGRQIGGKGMLSKTANRFTLALLALIGITILIQMGRAQKAGAAYIPVIPKIWDDKAVVALNVPLAEARYSPVQINSDWRGEIA